MLHQIRSTPDHHKAIAGAPAADQTDNETQLAAVKRYEILDTPPEPSFDRLTALAADLFDVPASVIAFIDADRLWFKSRHGLDLSHIDWATGGDMPVLRSIEQRGHADHTPFAPCFTSAHAASHIANDSGLRFCVSVPLRTADGHDIGALCVLDRVPILFDEQQLRHLRNYAGIAMDHLDQRLSALRVAAEARMMASETDHRTMNSLQFVASLLNMQSRAVGVPAAAEQLRVASNRVGAVARVHRHFAADESREEVPILLYLHRLCSELSGILNAQIAVEGDAVNVAPDRIMALGLIAHELVTNACKHSAGSIKVSFRHGAPGTYELCVADEGEGLQEDFTLARAGAGLGLRVVTALVSQLGGQLDAHPNPAGRGACFTVTFPLH